VLGRVGLTGFDGRVASLLPGSTNLQWAGNLGAPRSCRCGDDAGGDRRRVLIADALRARLGLTGRPPAGPWQQDDRGAGAGAGEQRALPWRRSPACC